MAQIKVYGLADKLNPVKTELSNIIHTYVIEVLQLTPEKRFHRFLHWINQISTIQVIDHPII